MRSQKCSLDLYVDFLIASQNQYSGAELSKVAPEEMAHDSVSRWLSTQKLTPKILWKHAAAMVNPKAGYLIIDDTVLDKPYSRITALVKSQYSGKHHRVVSGIDLVNMLWTDGEKIIPVDYRAYDPTRDGKSKNDHAQEMLDTAEKRGFSPEYVLLDIWYSSIENLKTINRKGWKWVAELKANRLVSVVQGTYVHVSDLDWTATPVYKVWLKAYGFVRVSEIVFEDGDIAYIATNNLSLTDEETIRSQYEYRWTIETFHRGIKQCCGIERCYSTLERSQRNHILCAFLAFLKLEWQRLKSGVSWYEQKWAIPRRAVTAYLAHA